MELGVVEQRYDVVKEGSQDGAQQSPGERMGRPQVGTASSPSPAMADPPHAAW